MAIDTATIPIRCLRSQRSESLLAIHAPGTAPIDIADDCSSDLTTEKPCSTSRAGTHCRDELAEAARPREPGRFFLHVGKLTGFLEHARLDACHGRLRIGLASLMFVPARRLLEPAGKKRERNRQRAPDEHGTPAPGRERNNE